MEDIIADLPLKEQERYQYLAEEFVSLYETDENSAAAWLYGQVEEWEWDIIKHYNREEFKRRGWTFPNDDDE